MRTPILVALVFLFGVTGTSLADPTIDDAGGFVATFPGPITHDSDETNIGTGKTKIYESMYAASTGNYTVSYCDIPVPSSTTINSEEAYLSAIQKVLNDNKGKLRSRSKCKLGNIEGQEFVEDIPTVNAVIRSRLFLVGNRLYQVIYAGFLGSENNKGVVDFLDSFRVSLPTHAQPPAVATESPAVLSTQPKTLTSVLGGSVDISCAMNMPVKPTWHFYLKSGKHSDDPAIRSSVMFDLSKVEMRRLDEALTKFAKWDAQALSTNLETGFTKPIINWTIASTALDGPETLFVQFDRTTADDAVQIFVNMTDKPTGNILASGTNFTAGEAAELKSYIDAQLVAADDPRALDALQNEHKPGDELK